MDLTNLIKAAYFRPDRVESSDAWVGHIPFAAWLVQTIKPSIIVELGTFSGNSYLAFGQSVKENKLTTKCYAVDTWYGDEHGGFYGEEIYHALNEYHEKRYSNFSRLLRMTFDEASSYFAERSIDLLHIDGLHTYAAVKHDFETWLPKLTPHAVVILHDINVHERGFGVWRFWNELIKQYPFNFDFIHSNGLGVLQLSPGKGSFNLEWLQQDCEYRQLMRELFANLGQRTIENYRLQETERSLKIVSNTADKYLAETNDTRLLLAERGHQISILSNELQAQKAESQAQKAELQAQKAELQAQKAESQAQKAELQAQKAESQAHNTVLQAQLIEQKQVFQLKMEQDKQHLDEREQILQGLNSRLLEIYSSTAWKLILIMWKIRVMLAPHGSARERLIKAMIKPIRTLFGIRRRSKSSKTELPRDVVEFADSGWDLQTGQTEVSPIGQRREALERCCQEIFMWTGRHGPTTHMIVLPWLTTGGGDYVGLNYCKAILEANPKSSVILVIADRDRISDKVKVPDGIILVNLSHFVKKDEYQSKQYLLNDLIVCLRPDTVHNINSEVGWNLIIEWGKRLKKITNLYACIFALQFDNKGKKIGYAASFLPRGLPHLTGLLTDNHRFAKDAIKQFHLPEEDKNKIRVIYDSSCGLEKKALSVVRKRLKVYPDRIRHTDIIKAIWAGRIDREKRLDIFFNLVELCDFVDFDLWGNAVVDSQGIEIPKLPNLHYFGAYKDINQVLSSKEYDVMIFTSKWEGLPIILLEVGAWGVPIIAPAVGGVSELVNKKTGYLLSAKATEKDYLKALKQIRNHPEEAAKKAGNMLQLIQDRHNWSAFVNEVRNIPNYL
jgi:glycosyltransferase involved in cell wall biosynthesis